VVIKSGKYRIYMSIVEVAENVYALVDEYRRDINTLRGNGVRK